ncbi:hypothetical protein Ciccas_012871 [Cichlidogyrus casuarinus]|uniref:Uncharacterized protein n=1 Tax=Cichlidogyrus casuarinus TaxID=1844966 RepID=A0ABD2PM66_9PLAT
MTKNGQNTKAYDSLLEELSADNDVVELDTDKADSSLVFANVERKVTYRGPIELPSIQSSMRQFDLGARMARFTDSNFEHDTQATTGSTTGDWLIILYDSFAF